MKSAIEKFFNPSSVAVVGLSENSQKLSSVIFNNIISSGYQGELIGIHPKHSELYGHKVYPSLAEYEDDIDLVVIVVSVKYIQDVIQDVLTKRPSGVVIITAGFAELGAEGIKLQDDIASRLSDEGILLLGPNCLGFDSTSVKLNASFAPTHAMYGNIAILSQSGAVNCALLDLANSEHVGIKYLVSLGNKAGISEVELIKYWDEDPDVKVIGAYLENFKDGKKLTEITSNTSTPIVLLNSGKTEKGATAIASHTGSIASPSRLISSSMFQSGVYTVSSIEEMYNTLKLLSMAPNLTGLKTCVVTNAGGPGVTVTDLLIKEDFTLDAPPPGVQDKLSQLLPKQASTQNPIDILGDAPPQRYFEVLEVLINNTDYDVYLVLLTVQHTTSPSEVASFITQLDLEARSPIVPVFIAGDSVNTAVSELLQEKVPTYRSIEDAVQGLRAIKYFSTRKPAAKYTSKHPIQLSTFASLLNSKYPANRVIHDSDTYELAKEFHVTMPKQWLIESEGAMDDFIQSLSKTYTGQFALKALNSDIAHKSDSQLVLIGLDREQLKQGYIDLHRSIMKSLALDEQIEILIQEMVKGHELFLGFKTDPSFGPHMVFGAGGIYAEIIDDNAIALIPQSREDLLATIKQTKVSRILDGARGKKPINYEHLLDLITNLQELYTANSIIREIDINPLIVNPDRAYAVDIKLYT